MSYNSPIEEVLDRVRRIETRVTIVGRHVGADVGGGRPRWDGSGRISCPTGNVSLTELMRVVPRGWDKGAHVYVNDEYLFSLTVIPQ